MRSTSDNESPFAKTTGKSMCSAGVSELVGHKLQLLVAAVFATMCRVPAGNDASMEDGRSRFLVLVYMDPAVLRTISISHRLFIYMCR